MRGRQTGLRAPFYDVERPTLAIIWSKILKRGIKRYGNVCLFEAEDGWDGGKGFWGGRSEIFVLFWGDEGW